ncbi:RIB43A-like with coiled-coils protein 1 [Salarias fasciatus]|uniref:RIB43A-like with coiled-coils protein 1 n=1 Tax=Salarias fasciatus TaxID=181472 RepID=UPI001176F3BE|nr:RIB43A-like with coiled-coils protein 1 [Salarias fasciatus]
MNICKLDLPDESADKAIQRRRAAEAARKARVFNTRLRVIGLDVDVLNQQVQQKKHQQSVEKQRDKAYDDLRICQDEALLQQDIEDKEKRASLQAGLAQYWATHQRLEDSRDADLKCGLKGASNLTLPESHLGPASMQIFQGEGIGEEQTRREQMKKTERDLRAQMDDNERKHMGDKHREMLMSREMANQDLRWLEQAALEEECKKAARMALDNYNQALAAEQAAKLKDHQRREEQDNLAEMWHILTSDMMTESADLAMGGGTPQVLPDRWKGMSAEQLRSVYREREEQRRERERQRQAEKIQDAVRDFQLLKLCGEAEEEESRAAQLRRERRVQMDQYNMQLAREQQAQQEYLNNKLYTNKPTKDYFQQFNRSSR